MRFKKGDEALTDGNEVVKVIDPDENNFYKVKFKNGLVMSVHDRHLINMPAAPDDKPASFKMNLALEQTLKEIALHLDDDNYTLIESVTNHDYHEAEGKHHITLNIVLKENK